MASSAYHWHQLKRSDLGSWADYVRRFSAYEIGSVFASAYIFRGQSDASWSLSPSLARILKPASIEAPQALDVEAAALRAFREQARLHLRAKQILPSGASILEWWVLMQHYGAPTRLLDWSSSPYVALYSAVVDHWDRDGCLFVLHQQSLVGDKAAAPDSLGMRAEGVDFDPAQALGEPLFIVPFVSDRPTDRMVAQQAHFTVASNPLIDHVEAVARVLGNPVKADHGHVIPVPAENKPALLRALRTANVTAASLFPGIDGFGRAVREAIEVETARLRPASKQNGSASEVAS